MGARVIRKKLTDKDIIQEARDFLEYADDHAKQKVDNEFLSNLESALFRSPPTKRPTYQSMDKHHFRDLRQNLDRFLIARKEDYVVVQAPTVTPEDDEFDFCEIHDEKKRFELSLDSIKNGNFKLRKRKKKKNRAKQMKKTSDFDGLMEQIQQRRKYFNTEESDNGSDHSFH